MTQFLAAIFLLAIAPGIAVAQHTISLEYCHGDACGLRGNSAPITTVAPGLRGADLAGRRYGAQTQQFVQEITAATEEFAELRDAVGDLADTPFSFEQSQLNIRVSQFFEDPNLIQSLRDVYSEPIPAPNTLPPSAEARLEQIWDNLKQGEVRTLVEAAERVNRLQRYARYLGNVGAQYETAEYLKAELRRNFVDERGVISFLGNSERFSGLISGPSSNPNVYGIIVDRINSLVIADYVLRTEASTTNFERAKPAIGAIASLYGTASALASTNVQRSTEILKSLDFAAKITDAFIDGFLSQGVAAVDAFITVISNPLTTAEAIYTAIRHADRTISLIASAVDARYDDFVSGDEAKRARIVGEISFDVATVFFTGGVTSTVKFGAKAVEFISNGAMRVVKAQFARAVRLSRAGNLAEPTIDALAFAERLDPEMALRLYRQPPARIGEIGRQIEFFLDSKSELGQLGRKFLTSNQDELRFYADELPKILDALESGESVKVYSKVPWIKPEADPMAQIREWTSHGMKGPRQETYWKVVQESGKSRNRFGEGRYVSLDRETPFLETPPNDGGWLLFEAQFRNVPNGAGGYIFYPSTKSRGGVNIYDRSLDDRGAFTSIKLIDEEAPRIGVPSDGQ